MKDKKNFKSGKSGPGPLAILGPLVLLVIIIFVAANYLSGFVPGSNTGGSGTTTIENGTTTSDTSSKTSNKKSDNSVSFKTESQGAYSKYAQSGGLIVEDESNFKKLWSQTAEGMPPVIDFSKEVVLAVFSGEQPTTGYSITISKIEKATNTTSVITTLITPGPKCQVVAKTTNPYHIVSIEKQSLPIEFISYDAVNNCD